MYITTFSSARLERSSFGLCAVFIQLALWWAYAMFVDYEFTDASSGEMREKSKSRTAHETFADLNTHDNCYHMFKDLRIMVLVGFGLLRVFQNNNDDVSPAITIIIAAVTLQWSVICEGVFHLYKGKIEFNVSSLLNAEMALAAVFISFGTVLQKASPLQLIAMALCETAFYFTNKYLIIDVLQTSDTGGSLHVHLFAAYFGIAVSFVLRFGGASASVEDDNKQTLDRFSITGILFLWTFWPLFNASFADGAAQHRALIHTYCAMGSCCTTVYAANSYFKQEKNVSRKRLLNATLAGGIAVGTAGDLMIKPLGALAIGILAGLISVLVDELYDNCTICRRISLDTSGTHTAHGIPGLLAGLCIYFNYFSLIKILLVTSLGGSFTAIMASEKAYSVSLYRHYPAMIPMKGTNEFWSIEVHSMGTKPGSARTALMQGGYQIAAVCTTLLIASLGGLVTGLFIRYSVLGKTSRFVLDDTQEGQKEVI